MTTPPKRRRRVVSGLTLLVSLALILTACSGGDEEDPNPAQPSSSSPETPAIVTEANLGAVAGRLPLEQRQPVVDEVTAVVEGYTDWAFLSGAYPRTEWDFPAPGFSKRANRRLRELDLTLGTNADIGGTIDEVTPISRTVTVDVLAPKGEVAGATGRFVLEFGTDGAAGAAAVRVTGRLVLVSEASGWQVVGYYLAKGPLR
jgi:hypothetical protein